MDTIKIIIEYMARHTEFSIAVLAFMVTFFRPELGRTAHVLLKIMRREKLTADDFKHVRNIHAAGETDAKNDISINLTQMCRQSISFNFVEFPFVSDGNMFYQFIIANVNEAQQRGIRFTFNFADVKSINQKFIYGMEKAFLELLQTNGVPVLFVFPKELQSLLADLYVDIKTRIERSGLMTFTVKIDEREK